VKLALLVLVACHPTPQPPLPAPIANHVAVDAGGPVQTIECFSNERRIGNTCCHKDGAADRGELAWQACRGPQLGKLCHRRGDCDIACSCDQTWVSHDGTVGVTGHCSGGLRTDDWACELDEHGRVWNLVF
jgi:hypothetical protein